MKKRLPFIFLITLIVFLILFFLLKNKGPNIIEEISFPKKNNVVIDTKKTSPIKKPAVLKPKKKKLKKKSQKKERKTNFRKNILAKFLELQRKVKRGKKECEGLFDQLVEDELLDKDFRLKSLNKARKALLKLDESKLFQKVNVEYLELMLTYKRDIILMNDMLKKHYSIESTENTFCDPFRLFAFLKSFIEKIEHNPSNLEITTILILLKKNLLTNGDFLNVTVTLSVLSEFIEYELLPDLNKHDIRSMRAQIESETKWNSRQLESYFGQERPNLKDYRRELNLNHTKLLLFQYSTTHKYKTRLLEIINELLNPK